MREVFVEIEKGYAGKRKGLPFTKYVSLNIAKPFTFLFYTLKISPNSVTVLSLLVALAAVGMLFLQGNAVISGLLFMVLLQLSYALDCSDGQLARLTGRQTLQGAWFDLLMDRIINFAVLTGVLYWYLERQLFAEMTIFLAVLVLAMFANLLYSHAVSLKGLMFQLQDSETGSNLLREAVFFPSDTGVFYLVLSATVFFANYSLLIYYSIYKLLLLLAVIIKTLYK